MAPGATNGLRAVHATVRSARWRSRSASGRDLILPSAALCSPFHAAQLAVPVPVRAPRATDRVLAASGAIARQPGWFCLRSHCYEQTCWDYGWRDHGSGRGMQDDASDGGSTMNECPANRPLARSQDDGHECHHEWCSMQSCCRYTCEAVAPNATWTCPDDKPDLNPFEDCEYRDECDAGAIKTCLPSHTYGAQRESPRPFTTTCDAERVVLPSCVEFLQFAALVCR